MTYQLISLESTDVQESPFFIEGAILAANFATQPLAPEAWLSELLGAAASDVQTVIVEQIHKQYAQLKRNEYSLLALVDGADKREQLADLAEGFMQVWPTVEAQWMETQVGDGTLRMLQALLTSFMLAIDEEQTQQQMRKAGVESPPSLEEFIEQLDLMVAEVAMAADEAMVGAQSQSVNPYKGIGRNDLCPCGSGKKFKQCCGQ
ncbi:SEC-C metal-binding domain-containing protein [Vibrio proteolyticus]